ncbi:response regulator [bacterium]|nr:response regulator [bacterium]
MPWRVLSAQDESLLSDSSVLKNLLLVGFPVLILLVVGLIRTWSLKEQVSDRQAALEVELQERRRAEERASKNERALDALMHNLPGMAYQCRVDPEWTMLFVSEGSVCLTGYSPDDLIGNRRVSFESLIAPEDRELVRREVLLAIEEGRHYMLEYRIHTASGEERWVWERGNAIRDGVGETATLEGFIMDICERKAAELQRARLESQVEENQRLESLGVLAGGIAHEFNNLLMGVLGNADLALRHLSAESPAAERINDLIVAARRASDLSTQMLAYSGRGKFNVQPIDLSSLVRDMVHLIEVTVRRQIEVKYDLAPDPPRIDGDAAQLRQVVMNLVSNASDAIGDVPGGITVRTRCSACEPEENPVAFSLGERPPSNCVQLEVADTGPGVHPEDLARIFEPFFSTRFTGRGLGLSAVQGIVRGHQGAIRVESQPCQGATFRLFFPASTSPVEEEVAQTPSEDDWVSHGAVLIVDDEPLVRDVAREMLRQRGLRILTASNGLEAIEVFREHLEIQAVVLDIIMPGMDGTEVFRRLRRIRPWIGIVLSSGYSEQDVASHLRHEENYVFIQKPYESVALVDRVRRVMKPLRQEIQKEH